jgi:hypothetical protein
MVERLELCFNLATIAEDPSSGALVIVVTTFGTCQTVSAPFRGEDVGTKVPTSSP